MADEKLFAAVGKLDAERIKEALAEGANPNVVDKYGYPILRIAAIIESSRDSPPEATRLLLEAGADVNAKTQGTTTLERVIANSRTTLMFRSAFPVIMTLLKHGAELSDELLSKVPEEFKEEMRKEATYQRRAPLLRLRYGPGGPMENRGVMAPKGGRRRKSVRRRKTKSRRHTRKH